MKHLILLAGLALGVKGLRAQGIAASTVSLGGSVRYYNSSNTSNNTANSSQYPYSNYSSENSGNQFVGMPAVSYFVVDNLAVGLNFSVSAVHQNTTQRTNAGAIAVLHDDIKTKTLSIGPFVQYYKMLIPQLGLTGQLGAGYQRIHDIRDSSQDIPVYYAGYAESTGSGYYVDLTPGIIFLPIPRFGLSTSVGSLSFNRSHSTGFSSYSTGGYTSERASDTKANNFGARFGLDYLVFGGTYYFGR